MFCRMMLRSFFGMMLSIDLVAVCNMCMMPGLLVSSLFVVLGGFFVVFSRLLVLLRRLLVMLGPFMVGH